MVDSSQGERRLDGSSRKVTRDRQVALEHVDQIKHQSEARREAEERLRVLVEAVPAITRCRCRHSQLVWIAIEKPRRIGSSVKSSR